MNDTTQFVFQLQKVSMNEKDFVTIFPFCSLNRRPTHRMFAIWFALMHFFYSWVLRAAPSLPWHFNSFPKIYSIYMQQQWTMGCQSSISISIFCRMLFCLRTPTIVWYFDPLHCVHTTSTLCHTKWMWWSLNYVHLNCLQSANIELMKMKNKIKWNLKNRC